MNKLDRRNMIFFGLGTIGRDMFYAFEANALIYYLSNVLSLPLGVFLATSMVFTVLRVFDALNDPLMGLLVDNTRSRHGRFKPPMALGALAGGACYLVLFADFGQGTQGYVPARGGKNHPAWHVGSPHQKRSAPVDHPCHVTL